MATYGQWARSREMRRVAWACGSEPVLVEEVVSEARSRSADCVTLVAGDVPESDIWAVVSSPLADPSGSQLVIVRSAERLKRWDSLAPLLSARDLDAVRVVFVSGEPRLSQVRGEEKPVLAPHLALLRDSRAGQLVECRAPDDWRDPPEWLQDWASRQLGGTSREAGNYLLAVTGGSVAEAAAVGSKIRLAGLQPTAQIMSALAGRAFSFTESLICGRRREAMVAAADMTPEELGRAIGQLASRLDVLAALRLAGEKRLDARETAVKLGVPHFLQLRYREPARSYSAARVASCRSLLAAADDAWRSGESAGVGEFVAALWAA
jgi:DNA polymerase III delta subunit